jgi:hypothetical protein
VLTTLLGQHVPPTHFSPESEGLVKNKKLAATSDLDAIFAHSNFLLIVILDAQDVGIGFRRELNRVFVQPSGKKRVGCVGLADGLVEGVIFTDFKWAGQGKFGQQVV